MNRMMKVGIAALALAAVVPAMAQNEGREGAIGWTPLAIGLATPVQLPWGLDRWDVFGLDVNVFYADAPKMYGIDISAGGTVTRDDFMGIAVGGLFNFCNKDVYGLRASLLVNMANRETYGLDAGAAGIHRSYYGLEVELLGCVQERFYGLGIGGLATVTDQDTHGLMIALGANLARQAWGMQLALCFNMTDELHGCQLGLVNYADNCVGGFQIGLVNIIMSNQWKVLPIINWYF